jgi:hypothetical protein
MKRLHTEVLIDASPADVWAVLTDFARYPVWNPFVVNAVGQAVRGSALRVTIAPPGARRMTLEPVVTELAPEQVLEWWGHLGVRGIFDGRHRFELHPVAGGTRLVQSEVFTGVLVPFVARSLDRGTAAGFAAMNSALKARAEQRRVDSLV